MKASSRCRTSAGAAEVKAGKFEIVEVSARSTQILRSPLVVDLVNPKG